MKRMALLLTGVVLLGCDSPAEPSRRGLEIVGAALSDTALAYSGMLHVRLVDGAVGIGVRFRTLPLGGEIAGTMLLPDHPSGTADVQTDADGVAAVRVRYGETAGRAGIEVTVPQRQLTAIAEYEVLPGAPTVLSMEPADTLLITGTQFAYRTSVFDIHGNARSDTIVLDVAVTPLAVAVSGASVHAVAQGIVRVRGSVVAYGVELLDSGVVAVVGPKRVAWAKSSSIDVGYLTGELLQTLPFGLSPSWDPQGPRLVYSLPTVGIRIQSLAGAFTMIVPDGVLFPSQPEYSHDGEWIYYHAEAASDQRKVYRMRRGGSSIQQLTDEVNAEGATPSPDGQYIAYISSGIVVRNLATGETARLPGTESAVLPRWSPDGNWIAYTNSGGPGVVHLISPDGAQGRTVGNHQFAHDLSWSPDSRLLAGSSAGLSLALLDPETNLAYITSISGWSPTWER